MKSNIYDQAVLEGVSTTFPQTEDIIDNGTVNGMTASDVQKIHKVISYSYPYPPNSLMSIWYI